MEIQTIQTNIDRSNDEAAVNSSRLHESLLPESTAFGINYSPTFTPFIEFTTRTTEKPFLPPIGEDLPWVIKYIKDNQEEAFLCLLFSLVVGICCILLAVLICVCCRWRQAKNKGSFTIVKQNNDGSGGTKGGTTGGVKETETLLNPAVTYNSSSGRMYSSPRLVRAEYARGISTATGGNAPPSSSNANVVGLYLSQAPKSRWSRASDAIVWPLPPGSVSYGINGTIDGDLPSVSTVSRTLPIQEQLHPENGRRNLTVGDSPFMPSLSELLLQNKQNEFRQPQPTFSSHIPMQSSFAPASSPTDYLFNRQTPTIPSIAADVPNIDPTRGPSMAGDQIDHHLLRKPLTDETLAQRKALSYHAGNAPNVAPTSHQLHHSYMGPHHPTSPPVVPAPATSPWPARSSQIQMDEPEIPNVSSDK